MERDLAAIQAKLDSLEAESKAIAESHPEEAQLIRERITQITTIWQELTMMVCTAFFHISRDINAHETCYMIVTSVV